MQCRQQTRGLQTWKCAQLQALQEFLECENLNLEIFNMDEQDESENLNKEIFNMDEQDASEHLNKEIYG